MTTSKDVDREIETSDIEAETDQLLSQPQQTDRKSTLLRSDLFQKLGSALFYGVASFLLTVVNKTVLTSWQFPSFLVISIGQLGAAIIVLYIGKLLKIVSIPNFTPDIPGKMNPLPFFHFGNMVTGLGGTQAMPLPMFTAIRRFSILMTMLLEFKILGVKPSIAVQLSVWCMVGGAILAASDDLSFTIEGYTYVMLANVITAAYGVYIKQKLDTIDIGKYGIMFYNSLLMFIPAVMLAWLTGDLRTAYEYQHWWNPLFMIQFLISCFMGFVLTYSVFLCTQYNSALTTAMVGCFKNVFVSYLGMFIGGDYIFSLLNCVGINISILGSIYYTYIIFAKKRTPRKIQPTNSQQV